MGLDRKIIVECDCGEMVETAVDYIADCPSCDRSYLVKIKPR